MANISSFLNTIKNAIYGRDMRNALHDSIKEVNDDVETRLSKSGGTMTGGIDMNENKITSSAVPSTDNDYANKKYIDDKETAIKNYIDYVDSKVSTVYKIKGSLKADYDISSPQIGDVWNCSSDIKIAGITAFPENQTGATNTYSPYYIYLNYLPYESHIYPGATLTVTYEETSIDCTVKELYYTDGSNVNTSYYLVVDKDMSVLSETTGTVVRLSNLKNNYFKAKQGDNIVYTKVGWDKLSATIDLSGYCTKSEVETELSKKVEIEEINDDIDNPKGYKIYKAMQDFEARGDTDSTLNTDITWYTNGLVLWGINPSLNSDGSPINYKVYSGTSVKISNGNKSVTVKLTEVSVQKFTGLFPSWLRSFENVTRITCKLDRNVKKDLNLNENVGISVEEPVVTVEFNNNTNKLQIKKNDLIRYITHGWDVLSRIPEIETELANYVKNTDYATTTKSGVIKVSRNLGTDITDTGLLYLVAAKSSEIQARTSSAKPIVPSTINSAVKSALSDVNRINDMTDDEKAKARGVTGAAAQAELDLLKQKSIPSKDVAGYPITLTDQLAGEKPIKLNIYGGKNLIPYPYTGIEKNGTIDRLGIHYADNGDGTITATGTASLACSVDLCNFYPANGDIDMTKKYTVSTGDISSQMFLAVVLYDEDNNYVSEMNTGASSRVLDLPALSKGKNIQRLWVHILISKDVGGETPVTFKPQIEEGTTATSYEANKGLGDLDSIDNKYKIPINCYSKNLIPSVDSGIYYNGSIQSGYPYIVDNSKKIYSTNNVNVSTYRGIYAVRKLKEGTTYTLSFKNLINNCATKKINFAVGFRSSEAAIFGSSELTNCVYSKSANPDSLTFTVPSGCPYCIIGLYNYPTASGDTISFDGMQVEEGTTATEYETYSEPSKAVISLDTPLEAGAYIDLAAKKKYTSAGEASDVTVSGEIQTTDSGKNTIEAETTLKPYKLEVKYYQDVNKVLDNLQSAILAQGGNV